MWSPLDGVRLRATDVVAAPLPAGPPLVELLAACWSSGAALLPLDPRLPAPALDRLLRRARPTVVVDGGVLRRLDGGLDADPGTAAVVATSGTSGEPRLVLLGRGAVAAAVSASAERLGVGADERWLLCVPPSHIGGLLVLFRGLLLGAPVTTHSSFDVDRLVGERDVRCVSLVPTMLRRLVDAGGGLGHLRTVLVGGDRLDAALADAARQHGASVVHTYGQTQSCGGVVYDGVALRGVSVEIDGDGEVLLGGPTVMTGYRDDDEATARAFAAGGRLRTGDLGEVDGAGVLRVLGRMDDVIVTGGEKVLPADVEAVLRSHPAVGDVAVVGEADEQWGERVVAVIVPAPGATLPALAELRALVRERLPAYAAPKDVVRASWLPVTTAGKVRREQLRSVLADLRATDAMRPR